MGSIFVTGSADGIGREIARTLITGGHQVVLHARNDERARAALAAAPGAAAVVTGDVSSLAETRALAKAASAHGPYDAVIHNVGVGGGAPRRVLTPDGLEQIFTVNVLAPYLLTALLPAPRRLVYLTSGRQSAGQVEFDDLQFERRQWDGMQAYSDSKLYDVVLAMAVARRWPQVVSNAVDPGWIRTRMGGPNATGELAEGADTPVWLATSDAPEATASGRYLTRRRAQSAHPAAYETRVQDWLLEACVDLTGVPFPA